MKPLILILSLASLAWSDATLGQIRILDFSAKTPCTLAAGSSNATVVTTAACSLTTGSYVWIYQPWTNAQMVSLIGSSYTGNYGRGYYQISRTDSTHFTLSQEMYTSTAVTDSAIAPGDMMVGPLTTYYVRQGPKLMLDGPIATGAWSNSKAYKVYQSVTSAGNTYVAIADNTNQAPPNATYWMQVNPALLGPGTFTASLKNTATGGKLNSANPVWQKFWYYEQNNWLTPNYSYDYSGGSWNLAGMGIGLAAVGWWAADDSASYSNALNLLLNLDDDAAGGVSCTPGSGSCGRINGGSDVMDTDRLPFDSVVAAVDLMYYTLTSAQKQRVRDLLLNHNDVNHNGIESNGGTNCTDILEQPVSAPIRQFVAYSAAGVEGTGQYYVGYVVSYQGEVYQVKTYMSGAGVTPPVLGGNANWTDLGLHVSPTAVYGIAGSGFNSFADMTTGSRILYGSTGNWQVAGRVVTKVSDTELALATNPHPITAAWTSYSYTHPFEYGGEHSCGILKWFQHYNASPRMIPTQVNNYPTDLNNAVSGIYDGPQDNRTSTAYPMLAGAGLSMCNDDLRGCRLAEQVINHYMTMTMAQHWKSRVTAFEGHGLSYGPGRVMNFAQTMARYLSNSLTVTPPGVKTGIYNSSLLRAYQFHAWLGFPMLMSPFDNGYSASAITQDGAEPLAYVVGTDVGTALLYPGDPWTPVTWDYYRNRRNDFFGQTWEGMQNGWDYIGLYPWLWALWDPSATSSPPTGMPLQAAMNQTDEAECIAAGLYCRPDLHESEMDSLTGWTGNDAQLFVHGATTVLQEDGYFTGTSLEILQNNNSRGPVLYNQIIPGITYLLGGNNTNDTPNGNDLGSASGVSEGSTVSVYSATAFSGGVVTGGTVTAAAGTYCYVNPVGGGYTSPALGYVQLSAANTVPVGAHINFTDYGMSFGSGYTSVPTTATLSTDPNTPSQPCSGTINIAMYGTDLYNWPEYVTTDRWAGDPVNGVANNSYMYTFLNLNPQIRSADQNYSTTSKTQVSYFSSTAAATSAAAEYIHFKSGSGQPSYVVVYDWVNVGAANQLRRYWHYQISSAGLNGGGFRYPSWMTNFDATNKAVILTVPNSARLNSKFLKVPGSANSNIALVADNTPEAWCLTTWSGYNPEASCAGNYNPHPPGAFLNSGQYSAYPGTYRGYVCASSDGSSCDNETAGEWISIHRPSLSLTDIMPPITQPSCTGTGGNCTAFQIADATNAKVGALARQGALLSGMAFTTTHSGTAQYVISGLAPGSVTVTVNGVAVSGSPFTVAAGDSTIEFTSTAGTVSMNGTAPTCSVRTTGLPGGTVGTAYSQTLADQYCTGAVTWAVSSGGVCAGLSLNSTTGVISGTPTTAQTCNFSITATDTVPNTSAPQSLSITIAPAGQVAATTMNGVRSIDGAIVH